MARITMKSSDIQRGWRDMLNHIIRGDEVVITHYGQPVALVSPHEGDTPVDPDAGATTELGDWHLLMADGTDSPEDYIMGAGITEREFDVASVVEEYRRAVDAVLPEGVTLSGQTVYGPYDGQDAWRAEAPRVREAVEAIDLWEIAKRHAHGQDWHCRLADTYVCCV